MIFIPGWLIAIITFPGVIVHEAAHMLFCRLCRVAVLDVCFFRVGNPAGYVVHEPIESFNTSFLVSVGPFIVNSLLCMALCWPAYAPIHVLYCCDPLSALLIWLGISIGMHAFPSNQDAGAIWAQAGKAARRMNPLAILSYPLVILICVANALRFFWSDAIYAVVIGLAVPDIVLDKLL